MKDKKRIVNIINSYLNPIIPLKEDEIKRYNKIFLEKRNDESNFNSLFFNNKNLTFYLILYENSFNINLIYKILNYCIEIMKQWNKHEKDKISHKYPIIVPIVIYSGRQKWNISNEYQFAQMKTTMFYRYKINLRYNLISIRKIVNDSKIQCISEIEDFIILENLK